MATVSKLDINKAGEEITLKEVIFKLIKLWHYLLSKWLIILIFGVVGGAIGYTYAYFQKPVYTAATTFVLEDTGSGNSFSNLGGLASIAGIDLGSGGGGLFQGDNILELYKSRKMIEKTLFTKVNNNGKNTLLIDYFIEFNKLRDGWKTRQELKNIQFELSDKKLRNVRSVPNRLKDSIIGVIVNDIRDNYLFVSKPDKKLSIIKAEVKSTDEFFAKVLDEQIVQNVNDFYVQTKIKKSIENVMILQQKVDSVTKVMNGAIYNAAAVADATPNLNPSRQAKRVVPIQRSQFSSETNKAVLGELAKNLEIAKMSTLKAAPLIQIIDQPVYPLEIKRTGKILGLILGGFISGFLIVMVLLFRKFIKEVLI